MLQLNRTQSARAGKMGGLSKYTNGQYHLLVKYTKRAGRNFTASNSADAVSSAPGRFARDGSTGRYPDQETAMGCATLFRTHVENVLFAEDEHRAQNNVLKSGGGAVSTPSAPTAVVPEAQHVQAEGDRGPRARVARRGHDADGEEDGAARALLLARVPQPRRCVVLAHREVR